MDTKRTFKIEEGPTLNRIIDAFKYAYDKNARVELQFSVAEGYTTPTDQPGCAYVPLKVQDFRLNTIQHEDGSGHSLNLEGYCRAGSQNEVPQPMQFKAYYNTATRTGTMQFAKSILADSKK